MPIGKIRHMAKARLTKSAFTIVELLVVITIIGLLAALVTPSVLNAINRGKEAALKQNLQSLRLALDDYYADNLANPNQLTDLVTSGYIRFIPNDPLSGSTTTWTYANPSTGLANVTTNSTKIGSNDQPYTEW